MNGITKMTQPELIAFVANLFMGIREEPKNSNNVIFNTHYYSRPVSGPAYPWCMVFVWDVFRSAGLSRLFYNGNKTASCSTLLNWARLVGQFIREPRDFLCGDVVLYDWSGQRRLTVSDHTGIFSHRSGDAIMCIEGNTSVGNDSNGGQVMLRSRKPALISGAFRPKWDYVTEDEMTQKRFNEMADQYFRDRAAKPESNWSQNDGLWSKAVDLGVFDGTAPNGICTREQTANVLGRLGLLKKPEIQIESPAFVNRADSPNNEEPMA